MSASPKSRLGRGLGGLIAAAKTVSQPHADAQIDHATPAASAAPTASGAPGYQEIDVHLIEPSPYQARREITPEQLGELAESIRSEGLLQPIVVRKQGDKFQLIAGERRWRAFQQLQIRAIPARIVEASNASSAALGLIENLQREGLNAIEEAHGYASLIRDFDLTQELAAERVGTPGAKSAVAGVTVRGVPVNLTVTFAVADAFAVSRTVMSIEVSAVTVLAVTVIVEPVTADVTGNTPLLLEKAE